MQTISIPTNDRLPLLQKCLESLRAADGIDRWMIVFSCEPHYEVCDYVARLGWPRSYFSRNPVQMGCWENTFRAAQFAMALGSTLNLYLEDDIVVSKDTLTLAEQFSHSPYEVLGLRRPEATVRPSAERVEGFNGGLFGDGFAWRKEMWPVIREGWFMRAGERGYCMWDWSMEHALQRHRQARPLVNRSQNIGITGTHQRGYDVNRHSPCYQGKPIERFVFA